MKNKQEEKSICTLMDKFFKERSEDIYNQPRMFWQEAFDKAVREVGAQVAEMYGIENPWLEGLVKVRNFDGHFPIGSDELYLSLLKGDKDAIDGFPMPWMSGFSF